ncbi:MAG: cyclic nucleotide-binding domain-containing protein [Chromatiaceae bacterium]|nr:cyclic nucleotide-binding domain-containing protein [Chromatiaceae bacterium]
MRKVLYILGQLRDQDVTWLGEAGRVRRVSPGEVLIVEGRHNDQLFIVLSGELDVTAGDTKVAALGAGEIIGELSFVDSAPPSASVTAKTESEVLALDHDTVQRRLARDSVFAAGFYRAIAMFLADRLRGTVQRMGYSEDLGLAGDEALSDELDDRLLDSVSLAGERFQRLLRTLGAHG